MLILLNKLKRNLSDYGLWITTIKLLQYLIKPVYEKHTYVIFFIKLDNFIYRSLNNDAFIYKFIDKNDTEIIKQIESQEEWLHSKLVDKLKEDCICIVALFNTKVCGFFLVNLNEFNIPLVHYKRPLRLDECFADQMTVEKKYRGKGLNSKLRIKMFTELRKRGIKKIYGGTLISNIATRISANKAGYKYLMDIVYFKFLMCKSIRFKRMRSYVY